MQHFNIYKNHFVILFLINNIFSIIYFTKLIYNIIILKAIESKGSM